MISGLATTLLGPLAGPERRRSAGRTWPVAARRCVAAAGALLVLAIGGWMRIDAGDAAMRSIRAAGLRGGLLTLEVLAVTASLVLVPAILAGGLASDKERGALALLLTTRVSSYEIVAGRLAGKLSQAGALLLAALPALAWLAGCAGIGPGGLATMIALPAAVALGAGGLSVAASALSRRGRDAVLAVFAIESAFFVLRLARWAWGSSSRAAWVGTLDPLSGVWPLAWEDDAGPALATVALWAGIGAIGVAAASWRLRPSCLRGSAPSTRRKAARSRRVPPVGDRPMLWKELAIERADALGGLVLAAGALLVAVVLGSAAAGAGMIAWGRWARPDANLVRIGHDLIEGVVVRSAPYLVWLIEWAVGLRAAVSIASERERGTWDALMMSPLPGTEIVLGKLGGSLFALRGPALAAAGAWTIALATRDMTPTAYALTLANVLVVGAFMAAVGVRASLASSTATRAMTTTLALWLVAGLASTVLASILLGVGAVIQLALWGVASGYGLTAPRSSPFASPLGWEATWGLLALIPYAMAASMVASETRLRFDRIAGRGTAAPVDPLPASPSPPPAPAPIDPVPTDEDDEILGPARPGRRKAWRPGSRDWP